MIAEETISQLAVELLGKLIEPQHAEYDASRRVHNGMIDKHPAAIAYCVDVADAISAVKYSSEHYLLVAVRGGGHSGAGLGLCDDGLVIDLAQMNGVHVDADRAGGGWLYAGQTRPHHARIWVGGAERYYLLYWRGRHHAGRRPGPLHSPVRLID